ncbi:unnamed protein product [Larinioides sclopetarius]|uniref:Granulin n=1 Tax=Larinioides sclopetarius TaxID=280406 RepID=A0AAV2B2F8_9ARAC
MKAFVLLVSIPSFITADILCPKSKTTCPEGKKCCEVDGEYSCCDSDVDLEEPAKVYAGVEYASLFPFANLSYPANESNEIMNCQFPKKQCGTQCCDLTDLCCVGCCRLTDTCCGNGCCRLTDICCGNHCCRLTDTCCGGGCCRILKKCCGNVCC